MFVDEKKVTVDAEVNHRNPCVIACDSSDVLPAFQTKNPSSLMVFGVVANDGSVMNSHFIATGLKIVTKEYLDILKTPLLQWMKQNFVLGADPGFSTKSFLKSNTDLPR